MYREKNGGWAFQHLASEKMKRNRRRNWEDAASKDGGEITDSGLEARKCLTYVSNADRARGTLSSRHVICLWGGFTEDCDPNREDEV